MAERARIQTTVVGSYPIPDWLAACPSEQALVDATRGCCTPRSAPASTWCATASLSLRRQPSRNQRHDRLLRQAAGRDAQRHQLSSCRTGAASRE